MTTHSGYLHYRATTIAKLAAAAQESKPMYKGYEIMARWTKYGYYVSWCGVTKRFDAQSDSDAIAQMAAWLKSNY